MWRPIFLTLLFLAASAVFGEAAPQTTLDFYVASTLKSQSMQVSFEMQQSAQFIRLTAPAGWFATASCVPYQNNNPIGSPCDHSVNPSVDICSLTSAPGTGQTVVIRCASVTIAQATTTSPTVGVYATLNAQVPLQPALTATLAHSIDADYTVVPTVSHYLMNENLDLRASFTSLHQIASGARIAFGLNAPLEFQAGKLCTVTVNGNSAPIGTVSLQGGKMVTSAASTISVLSAFIITCPVISRTDFPALQSPATVELTVLENQSTDKSPAVAGLPLNIGAYLVDATSSGFTVGQRHTLLIEFWSRLSSASAGSGRVFTFTLSSSIAPALTGLTDYTFTRVSPVAANAISITTTQQANQLVVTLSSSVAVGSKIAFRLNVYYRATFTGAVGSLNYPNSQIASPLDVTITPLPHGLLTYSTAPYIPKLSLTSYATNDAGTATFRITPVQFFGRYARWTISPIATAIKINPSVTCTISPALAGVAVSVLSTGDVFVSFELVADGPGYEAFSQVSVSCPFTSTLNVFTASPASVTLVTGADEELVAAFAALESSIRQPAATSTPSGYLVNTRVSVSMSLETRRPVAIGDLVTVIVSDQVVMDRSTPCTSPLVTNVAGFPADVAPFTMEPFDTATPRVFVMKANSAIAPLQLTVAFVCHFTFTTVGYAGGSLATGSFAGGASPITWSDTWNPAIGLYTASSSVTSFVRGDTDSQLVIDFRTLLPSAVGDVWTLTIAAGLGLASAGDCSPDDTSKLSVATRGTDGVFLNVLAPFNALQAIKITCKVLNLVNLFDLPPATVTIGTSTFDAAKLSQRIRNYAGSTALQSYLTGAATTLTISLTTLRAYTASSSAWIFTLNDFFTPVDALPCTVTKGNIIVSTPVLGEQHVTVTGAGLNLGDEITITCSVQNGGNTYDGTKPVLGKIGGISFDFSSLPSPVTTAYSGTARLYSYLPSTRTTLELRTFMLASFTQNMQFRFTLSTLLGSPSCVVASWPGTYDLAQPNPSVPEWRVTPPQNAGIAAGPITLRCQVTTPATGGITNVATLLESTTVAIKSPVAFALPRDATMQYSLTSAVTSYVAASPQQLTLSATLPVAAAANVVFTYTVHSAFTVQAGTCTCDVSGTAMQGRIDIAHTSGKPNEIKVTLPEAFNGDRTFVLKCTVTTPTGVAPGGIVPSGQLATLTFSNLDNLSVSQAFGNLPNAFATYAATSWLSSYFELVNTNYYVRYVSLVNVPKTAEIVMSFSLVHSFVSGSSCRISTTTPTQAETRAKSTTTEGDNNLVVFTPPGDAAIPYGAVITLRCPVKNPYEAQDLLVPPASVTIRNDIYAAATFTSAALPRTIYTTYVLHQDLFNSRMTKYFAAKPTSIVFDFPMLEDTAVGTTYSFVLNDKLPFAADATNPCFGTGMSVSYDSTSMHKVNATLTAALASSATFRLTCNIVAPAATVDPFVPATLSFVANDARQTASFPALVAKTVESYTLAVQILTLAQGAPSSISLNFALLENFAKGTIFTLVLNSELNNAVTQCTFAGTTVELGSSHRTIENRYLVEFTLTSDFYAGRAAAISCSMTNPSRGVGLPDTPLQLIFTGGDGVDVVLEYPFSIDFVPGFSGVTALSTYNADTGVIFTIALSFPSAISQGSLTLTVNEALFIDGTSCSLVVSKYSPQAVFSTVASPGSNHKLALSFANGFPLGGALTLSCLVSTHTGTISNTVQVASSLVPTTTFTVADLPFPVIANAVGTTSLSSIVANTKVVLVNSMWLVRAVPAATAFSLAMPSALFTSVESCRLYERETGATVTTASFTNLVASGVRTISTTLRALSAGTAIDLQCIVGLPSAGTTNLAYGPVTVTPPSPAAPFSITIENLPAAPVAAPAARDTRFLDTLRFGVAAKLNIEFPLVDALVAGTVVTITANSEFSDLICAQDATGAPTATVTQDSTRVAKATFAAAVVPGQTLRFSCTTKLASVALAANNMVGVTASYPMTAVDAGVIKTVTRSYPFTLVTNLERQYTVDVSIGTFLVNKATSLRLAFRVLDKSVVTLGNLIKFKFNAGFTFDAAAACTSPSVTGSILVTNSEAHFALAAATLLGDMVTITCPVTTPVAAGALAGAPVSLVDATAITTAISFSSLGQNFVTAFVTSSDVKSFLATQSTELALSFWLYEPLVADASSAVARFSLTVQNSGIASVTSCTVKDGTGSSAAFANVALTASPVKIEFDAQPNTRAGLAVTITCVVVNAAESAAAATLAIGSATLGGFTIPFPALINDPQGAYLVTKTLDSYLESVDTNLRLNFDTLEQIVSGLVVTVDIDPAFKVRTVVEDATKPLCTVTPAIFSLAYSSGVVRLTSTSLIRAGASITLECSVTNPAATASPTGAVASVRMEPLGVPRLFNAGPLDQPIVAGYSGHLTVSSLLLNQPTVVSVDFDAAEGFLVGDVITFSFFSGFTLDAVNCGFTSANAQNAQVSIASLAVGSPATNLVATLTQAVRSGASVYLICTLGSPSAPFTDGVVSARFVRNSFQRTISFPQPLAPFAAAYVLTSSLSNYYPSEQTVLTLRYVQLEQFTQITSVDIKLSTAFSGPSCTVSPTPASLGFESVTNTVKVQFGPVTAGTPFVFTCNVGNGGDSAGVLLTPADAVFASVLGNGNRPFAALPYPITSSGNAKASLASYFANRVGVQLTLEFTLLTQMSAGDPYTVLTLFSGLKSSFDGTTCTMDGAQVDIIPAQKEVRISPTSSFPAGQAYTIKCLVTTPAADTPLGSSASFGRINFAALMQPNTAEGYTGTATIESYYLDAPTTTTISFWPLEDIVGSDSINFAIDGYLSPTTSSCVIKAPATTTNIQTNLGGGSVSLVATGSVQTVAVPAGTLITLQCPVTVMSSGSNNIPTTVAGTGTVNRRSVTITFPPFVLKFGSAITVQSRFSSYIAGLTTTFSINFMTMAPMPTGRTIAWTANTAMFVSMPTCTLMWSGVSVATSSTAGLTVTFTTTRILTSATPLTLSCIGQTGAANGPASLTLNPASIDGVSVPLQPLLMNFQASEPKQLPFVTSFFAAGSSTVIQLKYTTCTYIVDKSDILLRFHSSLGFDAAQTAFQVDTSRFSFTPSPTAPNEASFAWTGAELPPNTVVTVTFFFTMPTATTPLTGNIITLNAGGRSIEMTTFGTIYAENMSVSLSSYYTGATTTAMSLSFVLAETWTSVTTSDTTFELTPYEVSTGVPALKCQLSTMTSAGVMDATTSTQGQASPFSLLLLPTTGAQRNAGTRITITADCNALQALPPAANNHLFSAGTFSLAVSGSTFSRSLVLAAMPRPIVSGYTGAVTSSSYIAGETVSIRMSFWAIERIVVDDFISVSISALFGSGFNAETSCTLQISGGGTLSPTCGTSDCSATVVRFNFPDVAVGTALDMVCTNVPVPEQNFPQADAVVVGVTGTLNGLTIGTLPFIITPMPVQFSLQFAPTATLTTYRSGANTFMALQWVFAREVPSQSALLINLDTSFFMTGSIKNCKVNPNSISAYPTNNNIGLEGAGSQFSTQGGVTFVVTCEVVTTDAVGMQVATLSYGSSPNVINVNFNLPQQLQDPYAGTWVLSSLMHSTPSVSFSFTFTPFVNFAGFTFKLTTPALGSTVTCSSSAFSTMAFDAATHTLSFVITTAPVGVAVTVLCTMTTGVEGEYAITAHVTHPTQLLEPEPIEFPAISLVKPVNFDISLDSKLAGDTTTLTLTGVAPYTLTGYSASIALVSDFAAVTSCVSDDVTVTISATALNLVFGATAVRTKNMIIACQVTNSAVAASKVYTYNVLKTSAPSFTGSAELVARLPAVVGTLVRESRIADASTDLTITFTAAEDLDGFILNILTGETLASTEESSCTIKVVTVVTVNGEPVTTRTPAGTVTVVNLAGANRIAVYFDEIAVHNAKLELVCMAMNADEPKAAAVWSAVFSLNNAFNYPLTLPTADVITSHVTATLALDNKRSGRASTTVTMVFQPSLPPAGYTLSIPFGTLYASITAATCTAVQAVSPGGPPVTTVGTVTWDTTTKNLVTKFNTDALKWLDVTIKCAGTLTSQQPAQTLNADFVPASGSDLPTFSFSADVVALRDEVVLPATLANNYVNETGLLTIALTIPEDMNMWTLQISTGSTFKTVTACGITVPGPAVPEGDPPSADVAAGTATAQPNSQNTGIEIIISFNAVAVKDSVVTLSCTAQNNLRSDNIYWRGIASKTGAASFEYGFNVPSVLYRPPAFTAALSSSIYSDYLATLTMRTSLTFALLLDQVMTISLENLFPNRVAGKTCSVRFGTAAVRQVIVGSSLLTVTVNFFDDKAIGTSVEIICPNLVNPANAAEVKTITGVLAGEVPLKIDVSNAFVASTPDGRAVASSYTARQTAVSMTFTFNTLRDLAGYKTRIVPGYRFTLTDACTTPGVDSTYTAVDTSGERLGELTFNAATEVNAKIDITCTVMLNGASDASIYVLSFTKQNGLAYPVRIALRAIVAPPAFVGELTSSLFSDTNVIATATAKLRYPISAGNKITFTNPFSTTGLACFLGIGSNSPNSLTTGAQLQYDFTAGQVNGTDLNFRCSGATIPAAIFRVTGIFTTSADQYSTIPFDFAFSNTLTAAHAVGNTSLSTYLPDQSGVRMNITFVALKNLNAFTLRFQTSNRVTFTSCDAVPGVTNGNSNGQDQPTIDLVFTSPTTVNQAILLPCTVRTHGATVKSPITARYFFSTTTAPGSGDISFDMASIVYSYTGTLHQSSNVQGETNTLTFRVDATNELNTYTYVLNLTSVVSRINSCTPPAGLAQEVHITSGAIDFMFTSSTAGRSIEFSCVVVNGAPRLGSQLEATVTSPSPGFPQLPIYYAHSGTLSREISLATISYQSFAAAGSRTTLTLTAVPTFLIAPAMVFRFPLPAHITGSASMWPISCTAKIGATDAVAITPLPNTKFSFTGLTTTVKDTTITFTCLNFPLPRTPRDTTDTVTVDVVTVDGTTVVLATTNAVLPAYPAPSVSAFGGVAAEISYSNAFPNARTPVSFLASPSLTSVVAVGFAVHAELAFDIRLDGENPLVCTLGDGSVTVAGTAASLRAASGVISVDWTSTATGTLDDTKPLEFKCSNVILPTGLRPANYYGSLRVGTNEATHFTADGIDLAVLTGLEASFSPNSMGTRTATYRINKLGIDVIAGNTLRVPVPEGTTVASGAVIACSVGTSNVFAATFLTTPALSMLVTVPPGTTAAQTDALSCTGLTPPRSTLAAISSTNFYTVYTSTQVTDPFAQGTVLSPPLVRRQLTAASADNAFTADLATSSVTIVVQGFSFPLAASGSIAVGLPADYVIPSCVLHNATGQPTEGIRVTTSTNVLQTLTMAFTGSTVPVVALPTDHSTYTYVFYCAGATLPDYLVPAVDTVKIDVYSSPADILSTATAGRYSGIATPSLGAVSVNSEPYPESEGPLSVTWASNAVTLSAGDIISVGFAATAPYVFSARSVCSVYGSPVTATLSSSTATALIFAIGGPVPASTTGPFLLTCTYVTTPTIAAQQTGAAGTTSLRILRAGNAAQVKGSATVVAFTVLKERPSTLIPVDVVYTPPGEFVGTTGTATVTLVSATQAIPADSSLRLRIPQTSWTVLLANCAGNVPGTLTVSDTDTFTYTFGDAVALGATFTLSCASVTTAVAYRAASTVTAEVLTSTGTKLAEDLVTMPAVVGSVSASASLLFAAPTVGAVGTVTVAAPSVAAVFSNVPLRASIIVPAGTTLLADAVCSAGSAIQVTSTPVITTNWAAYTATLEFNILRAVAPAGGSYTFSCTGVRSPLAVVAASNTAFQVRLLIAASSEIAARGYLIFAGIAGITSLSAAQLAFDNNAGAFTGLTASFPPLTFPIPVGTVWSFPIPATVSIAPNAQTQCTADDTYVLTLNTAAAAGTLELTAAVAIPASSASQLVLHCTSGLQLPTVAAPQTETTVTVSTPTGVAQALTAVMTSTVVFKGVVAAVLSVEITPADARVAVSSALRFTVLPTTVNAAAGDILTLAAPTYFTYVFPNSATTVSCTLGSATVSLTVVLDADKAATAYKLAFPAGAALKGPQSAVIQCPAATSPSRALAETRAMATLANAAGTSIRGQSSAGAAYSAIVGSIFATRWSRIIPASTTAGSGFGMLTLLLSPITVSIPLRGTFVVTLPSTWAVTSNAVTCIGGFNSASMADATVPLVTVVPQVAEAANKVLRISAAQVQIARTDSMFRIFCDNSVRVPSVPTAATSGPFVTVMDSNNMPLMQALAVELPEITASTAPVQRVGVKIGIDTTLGRLTAHEIEVLRVIFANMGGIPLENVVLREQIAVSVAAASTKLEIELIMMPTNSVSVEDLQDMVTNKRSTLMAQMKQTMSSEVSTLSAPYEADMDASCADGVVNGSETSPDCGGSQCLPCALGKSCSTNSDCESRQCTEGRCTSPDNAASAISASLFVYALIAAAALFIFA